MKRAGRTLLWCVSGFGTATILFGLSKAFWLSLGLLFFIGAFDSVSVIIRGSIVQLVTPDEMRGRVSAVNNIFIGTSNEFGALESGLTAALFGPVISVVAGGIGTILVVLGVASLWPETRGRWTKVCAEVLRHVIRGQTAELSRRNDPDLRSAS